MASVVNLPASLLRFYPPGDCSQDRWLSFVPGEVYTQRISITSAPANLLDLLLFYKVGNDTFPLTGTITQVGVLNEYILTFTAPNVSCYWALVIKQLTIDGGITLQQGFEINADNTIAGGPGSPTVGRVNDEANAFAGEWFYRAISSSDQVVGIDFNLFVFDTFVSEPVVVTFAHRIDADFTERAVENGTANISAITYTDVNGGNGWTFTTASFLITCTPGQFITVSVLGDTSASTSIVDLDQISYGQAFISVAEIAQSACISLDSNSALLAYESNCNIAGYSYASDPETSQIRVSCIISDALPQIEEDLFTTSTGQEVQLRATVVLESRASFAYLPADALAALVYALKHPTVRINGVGQVAKSIEVSDTDRYASISRTLTATLRPAVAGIVFTDCCS